MLGVHLSVFILHSGELSYSQTFSFQGDRNIDYSKMRNIYVCPISYKLFKYKAKLIGLLMLKSAPNICNT